MDVFKSKGSDTTGAPVVASHTTTRVSCGKEAEKTEGNRSSYQFKREMGNNKCRASYLSHLNLSQQIKDGSTAGSTQEETTQIEKLQCT